MSANANNVAGYGWAAFDRFGRLYAWNGVHRTRNDCIVNVLPGCMGYADYARLTTDSARWRMCYRQGCRIRKVAICELSP